MRLSHITLTQFKNHQTLRLECDQLNCITGLNGVGKTNILDAIHTLCMGGSHFASTDRAAVQQGKDFFRLEGGVEASAKRNNIVIKYQVNKGKTIVLNDKELPNRSQLLGKFPVVIIAPTDDRLVYDGSEIRRKLYNSILAQTDPAYIEHVTNYHKLLKQRNALLKDDRYVVEEKKELCKHYTRQMAAPAAYVYEVRKLRFPEIRDSFVKFHSQISLDREKVEIELQDMPSSDLIHLHEENIVRDILLKRTTQGIHRADIAFSLQDQKLKSFGSQGQIKTAVIAMKLAQYEHIVSHMDTLPILLLDDIFDRLDMNRVERLLGLLMDKSDLGQVFLTDTDQSRVRKVISSSSIQWTELNHKDR